MHGNVTGLMIGVGCRRMVMPDVVGVLKTKGVCTLFTGVQLTWSGVEMETSWTFGWLGEGVAGNDGTDMMLGWMAPEDDADEVVAQGGRSKRTGVLVPEVMSIGVEAVKLGALTGTGKGSIAVMLISGS